jgi:serine/threonine protein kinase
MASAYFVKTLPAIEKHLAINIYEGFMISGVKHGQGRYTWADGQVTLGNWIHDECDAFKAELQRRNESTRSKERKAEKQEAAAAASKKGSVPKTSGIGTKAKAKKKPMKDFCVACRTQCSFSFQCLNCTTGYCDSCEKSFKEQGFEKRRPPCKCMIGQDGKAVAIEIVPEQQQDIFDLWNVLEVGGHFLDRIASNSAKHVTFIITFSHISTRGIKCTTLCEVGRLNTVSQTKLFVLESVRDYVRGCQPQPAAFAHLQKRWINPAIPLPKVSLTTKCYEHDWAKLFKEGRMDVDSLEIKSFCLTKNSIDDLITFVPRQLDVGTAWSSVKPPHRYYILCGPRPTIMVYIGIFKSMNTQTIRREYARSLTAATSRFFQAAAKEGSCMFDTVKGSIDTTVLMEKWLTLVQSLETGIRQHGSEEEQKKELQESEKMKLVHIVYHGWKSHPDEIQNGFTSEHTFDNCRSRNFTSFHSSFDLAQQFIADSSEGLTDANCTSIIRIPVFQFADNMEIPGFKQKKSVQEKMTFGMFGPLPGESKMGSIMMERSDEDDSIFPKNVSRVKIYPSIVNFIKQALAPPQKLKGRLTNQQLNRFADNVCDRYLSRLSSPACIEYKAILMAFRIECTMHLDDENYCLDKLKQQFQGMTKGILQTLQQKLRVTMIAVEDISNITTFCLDRYYKMCLGKGSTLFRDQKIARAMVLSLWHVVGYHCHKATTDAHKNYLINVDMDDYETVEGAPIKNLKSGGKQQKPAPRKDWSQTPKEAIQTVIDALTFMNLYEKKKKDSGDTQWYYMYRKVCHIVIGKDTCPWCYSSVRRLKEAAKMWTEAKVLAKFGKQSLIACKSNHFSTLEELAIDVTKRIEHHNTGTANVKDLIESMFLPVLEKTRRLHTNILKDILKILCPNDAGREEGREVEVLEVDDCFIFDHENNPATALTGTTGVSSEWFIRSSPTTAQKFANDKSSPGTTDVSSESISPGKSVLARHSAESPWTQAYVLSCRGTQYMVQFFEAGAQREEHQVSKENVKHFDWNYWKQEMKSWNYNDFKEQLQVTGGQCQEDGEQGKGLVALENLPVGSVVVEHTKCTAYKEGNQAGAEEECNCELLFIGSSPTTAQNSQREDTKVGFVVTTRQVQQGEKLKWLHEPDIIQSIMFSMQGDVSDARDSFDLHAYMALWRLRMPSPSSQNITIAGTAFETRNFGSSIKPFLHQATIDLLLMEDIANWLDIDANNSFVVHLAIAMNKNPLALHTMFARNCTRNLQAKQDRVWTPDVLAAVLPSSLNFKIVILVNQKADDTYTCKIYGSDMHDAEETPGSSVVLVQDGRNYSWLRATRIQDVNIKMFQHNCQYAVEWETLTKKSVFIRGCHNSETQAPVEWKNSVWNTACEKVGLIKSDTGKWLTKPPGFNLDLTFQDGSLTPQSFAELQDVLGESMTSGSVADLGSEAGHAVAQFAFMPFVNQVIGIEIQYAWVAYSVIMMQHLKSESYRHNHHLADIHIIHGSFLDTTLSEWEAALRRADLCFCNNFNWDKGSVSVPQGQQALTGEFRNKINVNVAHLLVDKMKFNSRVLVFDETSFTGQAYQVVKTLELRASWSTMKATKVVILRMCPTHFKVLKKALQTLCQAKNCNFGSLPKDWWENEVNQSGEGFLRLNDHILKQDYFEKSNASVHLGWNVTAPMTVCIKKFPDLWGKTKDLAKRQHQNIMQEIHILEIVAMNEDTSTHNVIRFLGTDVDRKGGTVLIFEMVHSSRFNSDLQSMTTQQIRDYMYRLLQALNYLHERNVVHRDVKPENFLHNFQSNTFRLIDFGSAEKGANGFVKTGGGTRGFRAPEILQGIATQTAAVDVWSAGIILLSLITGKPYILSQHDKNAKGNDVDVSHLKEIEEIVGKTEIQQLNEGKEYGDGSQHENTTGWAAKALQSVITARNWKNDDHALDLLSKMLNVQSSERITSADALKHPFFSQP